MSSLKKVYITDLASFMPNPPVTNDKIEDLLGTVMGIPSRSKELILRSNGIKTRHYAIDPKTTKFTHNNAKIAAESIHALMEKCGMSVNDIQFLSCGTASPDQIIPSHASMVHGELKNQCMEIVSTAGSCGASVSALKYAYLNVISGMSDNAVVSASEFISSCFKADRFEPEVGACDANLERRPELAFEKDFLRWMLSDGAGAAMIKTEPNKDRISLQIDWIEQLSFSGEMPTCMLAGGVLRPDGSLEGYRETADVNDILRKSYLAIKQDAKLLNKTITDVCVGQGLSKISQKHHFGAEDITWFLPHLSSEYFRKKTNESLVKIGFEIPMERWFTNLSSKGNTASAAIMIMLDELFYSGKLKVGDRILCAVPESAKFSLGLFHLTVV